jgi:hypothetical protein
MTDELDVTPQATGLSAALRARVEPIYMDDPPKHAVAVARPANMEQHIREEYELPGDWQMVSWERKSMDTPSEYLVCEGAIYKQVYTRGPRKGHTHFGKPEPGTSLTVSITAKQHQRWLDQWERDTGLCRECQGSKWSCCGWNHEKGNRYRPCDRCGATGQATNAMRVRALGDEIAVNNESSPPTTSDEE